MPETLETIALSLRELRTSMDEQFKKVDQKIDERAAKVESQLEMKMSHLEIKIEAVQDTVNLVYDAVISNQQHFGANEQAHETFTRRLDAHDLRILRLESRKPR